MAEISSANKQVQPENNQRHKGAAGMKPTPRTNPALMAMNKASANP